jgi:hypothetical protein
MTETTMDDLSRANTRHWMAREEMIKTAVAANLSGVSANDIVRELSSVPGLNRNSILAILGAGRRVAATQEILDADPAYEHLYVHLGGDFEKGNAHLVSMSKTPLGAEAAHRLWIALARQGLTIAAQVVEGNTAWEGRMIDAPDPEAALAQLAEFSLGTPDYVSVDIVNIRPRR